MSPISPISTSGPAGAGTAPRRPGPVAADSVARTPSSDSIVRPAQAPPGPPRVSGSQTRVIASGQAGVRHPVVYQSDPSQRFVRVPDTDQPVAFLLAVYG